MRERELKSRWNEASLSSEGSKRIVVSMERGTDWALKRSKVKCSIQFMKFMTFMYSVTKCMLAS